MAFLNLMLDGVLTNDLSFFLSHKDLTNQIITFTALRVIICDRENEVLLYLFERIKPLPYSPNFKVPSTIITKQ